jgi:hypothetical protein
MNRKEAAELRREVQELREEIARLRWELSMRPSVPQYVPVPAPMPYWPWKPPDPFPWPPLPVIVGPNTEPLPPPGQVRCGAVDVTWGCAPNVDFTPAKEIP